MQTRKKKQDIKRLTTAAVFCALAFGISALCNVVPITLVPSLPFLHYDAKDVLIAICGLILGPVYALGVSLVSALLELAVSSTGLIGMLMNFLSSAVFSCSCALVYKAVKSIKGAFMGLAASTVLTTAFMLGWNYLITPLYMGISREAVAALLIPAFLPFNLIKCGINAGICLLIYKPVVNALRKAKVIPSGSDKKATLKSGLPAILVGICAISACVATALYLNGVSIF